MITVTRTDSDDAAFQALVKLLDAELARRDGADHGFYSQFNKIDKIRHAVVCYENDQPIGCGAIKAFSDEAMEVKRMYVSPEGRKKGIATRVLNELEVWASELGYLRCVLETGKRQPEAIALYEKSGYTRTPNYGQYAGIENSVCFEKVLEH
ncbi:GNAT family N-acetyltransferase [Dyadobacter sp. 50-39]|uniref:GNAT family N-acetyltransferase n=1 Tax=Dyadobacter sp. 50-39 TaxID=1895756 RepID=UPI000A9930D6|nr:GNAT family N-acetyltransferase [Dyadobacter sp. 50-39]